MNKRLETTREMKESSIEWVGEIPKEWELKKGKYLFKQSMKKGGDHLIQLASTQAYGVVPQSFLENVVKVSLDTDLSKFKEVKINDFVISLRSFQGGFEIAKYNGVITPAYTVFRSNTCIHHNYFKYLFKAPSFISKINSITVGIREGKDIKYNDFSQMLLPIPPLYEQQAIATYLDEQVEKMDGLISAQKQAIEKWKAYKQSLITEAVTKGLNPEVEMKDSGIEWIGEIPKEWEINKIKHCCYLKGRIGWQGLKSDEFIDDGPFLVTGTDFKNGVVNWETCRHISMERYEEAFQIQLKNDDMLVTKDGTIGKVALVKGLETKASLNSGVFLVRNIKNSYATKYLYYVMLSEVFWKYFKLTQNGSSTIVHLYQEIYKEFSFPFPEKHIQQAIADYLDEKCSKIDETIEQKELLIKQLEEYKQSLIYECVTGKREVH